MTTSNGKKSGKKDLNNELNPLTPVVNSTPITKLDSQLSLTNQSKNMENGVLPREFIATFKDVANSGLRAKSNIFHAYFLESFNAGKLEISNLDIFNAMEKMKISSGLKKNDANHKWYGNRNMFGNKPAIFENPVYEVSNCAENFLWINRRVKVSENMAYIYGSYTYRLFSFVIGTNGEAIYTLIKK